jgi:hypothetical protein
MGAVTCALPALAHVLCFVLVLVLCCLLACALARHTAPAACDTPAAAVAAADAGGPVKRNAELFFPAEFADDFPVSLQVSVCVGGGSVC